MIEFWNNLHMLEFYKQMSELQFVIYVLAPAVLGYAVGSIFIDFWKGMTCTQTYLA